LHLKPGATVQQVFEQLKKNDVQLQCYIDESNERHHPLDPESLPYDGIHDLIDEGLRQ